jgi:hypothetical protein
MADIVIDEWLWADLAGENSYDAQKQAFKFICKIYDKCDRIVMVKESKFIQKFWDFCKSAKDVQSRQIANYYKDSFCFNPDKSVFLEGPSLRSVPEKVSSETKADDHYLIQALITAKAQVIVTTDESLKETLIRNGFSCALRDEFVRKYISQ